VLADLDPGDTIGVWVNDKTKLMDNDKNRFTHFIGILIRPDNVRFLK
jgi:ribosomal protein L19